MLVTHSFKLLIWSRIEYRDGDKHSYCKRMGSIHPPYCLLDFYCAIECLFQWSGLQPLLVEIDMLELVTWTCWEPRELKSHFPGGLRTLFRLAVLRTKSFDQRIRVGPLKITTYFGLGFRIVTNLQMNYGQPMTQRKSLEELCGKRPFSFPLSLPYFFATVSMMLGSKFRYLVGHHTNKV